MNSGDAVPDIISKNFEHSSSSPSPRERIEVRVETQHVTEKLKIIKISGFVTAQPWFMNAGK
jgi:hypothetical protein